LSESLNSASDAMVLEDGAAKFELGQARYSICAEYNRSSMNAGAKKSSFLS